MSGILIDQASVVQTGLLQRLINTLRYEGMISFGLKAMSRMGYRSAIFLVCPLEKKIPRVGPKLYVTIDLLDRSEVDEFLAFRNLTSRAIIERRMANGAKCFVARRLGQMVSAAWVSTRRAFIPYLSIEVTMKPRELYIHDTFTDPAFRGQRISPAVKAEILRHFRAQGFRKAILGMASGNKPNLHAVTKVGFRPSVGMRYIRLGTWQRHSLRPLEEGVAG